MKRVALFLSGLLVALIGASFAVTPTGGFPSRPTFQYVGVGTPASSGITRVQAANGGAGDVEILASTTVAGNAQFRAVDLGGTNWSFGNLRSDNSFDICNAATLTGTCLKLQTSGSLVAVGSLNGNNAVVDNTAGNVQYILRDTTVTKGTLCLSITAGSCTVGDSADDTSYQFSGTYHFAPIGGASNIATLTQAGVFNVKSGGDIQINGVSVAGSAGTFNLTISSGCTTTPTIPIAYSIAGKTATLTVTSSVTCTSNATNLGVTGLIAAVQPIRNTFVPIDGLEDNTVAGLLGSVEVSNGTNVFFGLATVSGSRVTDGQGVAWTASGTKGIGIGTTWTYPLN